jgi:hypothetical protein
MVRVTARVDPTSEWHLLVPNSIGHIAFGFVSRLDEEQAQTNTPPSRRVCGDGELSNRGRRVSRENFRKKRIVRRTIVSGEDHWRRPTAGEPKRPRDSGIAQADDLHLVAGLAFDLGALAKSGCTVRSKAQLVAIVGRHGASVVGRRLLLKVARWTLTMAADKG